MTPREYRFWKWTFLGADGFLTCLWIMSYLAVVLPGPVEVALVISGIVVWLFLFVGSPFFLTSLRAIALGSWLLAFGYLVIGQLTI